MRDRPRQKEAAGPGPWFRPAAICGTDSLEDSYIPLGRSKSASAQHKMDTTCSAITAETMTSKTFAFRQVHGHIHSGMRDSSRLRFLCRLLHVPARLKTLETSALVRVFATWPPSLTRSGRAWCDFSCAVWCVPSLFDTSVDVTGERNIASLIAFGGADRRAQAS